MLVLAHPCASGWSMWRDRTKQGLCPSCISSHHGTLEQANSAIKGPAAQRQPWCEWCESKPTLPLFTGSMLMWCCAIGRQPDSSGRLGNRAELEAVDGRVREDGDAAPAAMAAAASDLRAWESGQRPVTVPEEYGVMLAQPASLFMLKDASSMSSLEFDASAAQRPVLSLTVLQPNTAGTSQQGGTRVPPH